jgi:hypothetical protein
MPFWSLRSRAEKVISSVAAYRAFEVEAIPILVGLNWSGVRATGYPLPCGARGGLTDSTETAGEGRRFRRQAALKIYDHSHGRIQHLGNDWPQHKGTETDQERTLGVWLHSQRMKHLRRELDPDKETQLNTDLPGWQAGRVRGRKAPRKNPSNPYH